MNLPMGQDTEQREAAVSFGDKLKLYGQLWMMSVTGQLEKDEVDPPVYSLGKMMQWGTYGAVALITYKIMK